MYAHSSIAMLSVTLLYPGFSPILIIALNLFLTILLLTLCSIAVSLKVLYLARSCLFSTQLKLLRCTIEMETQFHLFADDKQSCSRAAKLTTAYTSPDSWLCRRCRCLASASRRLQLHWENISDLVCLTYEFENSVHRCTTYARRH